MVVPPSRTVLELLVMLGRNHEDVNTEQLAHAAEAAGWRIEGECPWFGLRRPIEHLESEGLVAVEVDHEPFGDTIVRHFTLTLSDQGRTRTSLRPHETWHAPPTTVLDLRDDA